LRRGRGQRERACAQCCEPVWTDAGHGFRILLRSAGDWV
jgi:hypothetical protein